MRVEEAFDTNTKVFSDTIRMTEAMTAVLQRVLDEQLQHGAPMYMSYGRVDWNAYLREFWLCMLMADFAAWCTSLQKQEKSLIVVPDKETTETIVFGG